MLHAGNVIKLQNRWWGHLHSTKDILQSLDYCQHQQEIPDDPELLKLMNLSLLTLPTWKKLNPHQLPFDGVTDVFIELSSMKAYEYRGQSLVIDRLPAYFSRLGPEANTWLKQLKAGHEVTRDLITGHALADH